MKLMIRSLRFLAYILPIFLVVLINNNIVSAKGYCLDDLYRIALERSEIIKLSEKDLYIAELDKDRATSVLFPKLSAFGNYTRYSSEHRRLAGGQIIQPDESISWGIRLDQSFSISGRELTALKIAKETIEKNKYDLKAAKEAYLFNVSSAYYNVLRAKKTLEIANASVFRLTAHRDAAAIKLRVGEVTKTDLLRTEAELSGAKSELIRAENSLKLARAVLARVVGLGGDFEIKEPALENETVIDHNLNSLKEIAFKERAEKKSSEIQKEIMRKQVKYTKGAYWPILSIEGVLRRDESPQSPFFNRESIYSGLKFTFLFFDGGLTKAEVKKAEARHRQAELIQKDLKKTISIEVENAYLNLITQRGVIKSLEDQLSFAIDNYNAVFRQYKYGVADSIDVIDANTLLITTERQLSDVTYNYQLSILRLKQATGTLLKDIELRLSDS